ncbi:MAG: preprotein translocase subunit SecA, partial [Patescibacteria group bacterium]
AANPRRFLRGISIMLEFVKNIFGNTSLSRAKETVEAINASEPEISKLDDAGLKARSQELKTRLGNGESLDDILAEAFALARETARRTLGQRPYDEQILGGISLHNGAVTEMATGEGKTLAAVAPAYLNALEGKGVHVVTVNEYLARRDTVWMGQIYRALGLTVACLVPNAAFLYDPSFTQIDADNNADKRGLDVSENQREGLRESALLDRERDATGSFLVQQEFLRPITRREAYLADITYGTNHEFGFDYLRDNLVYRPEDQVQTARGGEAHGFAIIDEVDSILIDEARTPLIISAPDVESSDFYKTFARVVSVLKADEDYTVDEKHRSVAITQEGIGKVEKMIGVKNLYAPENLRLAHYLEESLRAKALFKRDKDYVVKNGEILIVDEFTGRLLQGRRYSGGLHQAIEAKESVLVKEESRTYAKISIQNYFRMYKKISGMTGTAQTSAEEFYKVYALDTASIPTHKPMIREERADAIYKHQQAKWQAVVKEIKECYERGQPVLVGTTSIAKNELVSALLSKENVPHEILNAKNNEREGAIIAQAGRIKAITVATNMAGRGVDIILGGNPPNAKEADKVCGLGGLHIVGTERHEARRIDNQLRGRSGRQGDPGSSQFFLALDDDLMRIFGGDRIKGLMERLDLPDDLPLQMNFVSKAVAQAQARVEGTNFDIRKHLLEYDDVLNKQRGAVYRKRQEILTAVHRGELTKLIYDSAAAHINQILPQVGEGEGMLTLENLHKGMEEAGIITKEVSFDGNWDMETLEKELKDILSKRSVEVGGHAQATGAVLNVLDYLWMNHLEDLEALSESVGLRAYGQKDPLVEYRQEGSRLWSGFWDNFNALVFNNVFKLTRINADDKRIHAENRPSSSGQTRMASGSKVGRNDPCPCGSGKKYKKCHGR